MAFEEIAVEEMDWAYHVKVEPSSGANSAPWTQVQGYLANHESPPRTLQ